MISTGHCYIRSSDPDDAEALYRLHDPAIPRAALLDNKREPLMPTRDDLRELLGRKEGIQGAFYTVEDAGGVIAGFCGLRGYSPESSFAEFHLLFEDEGNYALPLADDAMRFILDRGFQRVRLHKLMIQCLDTEVAMRALLVRHGFQPNGVQREVFFSGGRYRDLETLSKFAQPRSTESH